MELGAFHPDQGRFQSFRKRDSSRSRSALPMGELWAVVKGPPHRALPLHFHSLARSTLRELRRPLLNPLVLTERVNEVVIAHTGACREGEGRITSAVRMNTPEKWLLISAVRRTARFSGSVSI